MGMLIPATVTRRRLRSLQAEQVSLHSIAQRYGLVRLPSSLRAAHTEQVTLRTHLRVQAVWRQMMLIEPDQYGEEART